MARHGFLGELRHRRIFRVGAAYVVCAWLVLQLAALIFPLFNAPGWTIKVVLTLLVLGFPLAVALAWGFDLNFASGVTKRQPLRATKGGHPQPHHLPRTHEHPQRRRSDHFRRVAILMIALFAVSVVVLAGLWYRAATKPSGIADMSSEKTAIDSRSIAVLPFENLSADRSNVYFAGGMQQEILTRLASIRALKVISRNSTDGYDSRPDDLKTVAAQLGVATLLEGSVQKAADKVHITVQLIDAVSGAHLWADSYDGDLKDMFGVERDVASKVASALQAQLLPAEAAGLARVPTTDPAAYDLYLRGGYFAYRAWQQDSLLPTELPKAIALYQQALQSDPQFALAAAALGRAQMQMYFNAPDHTAQRLAAAKAAIDRALALQPDLGEAHFALGLYDYWGHRDYPAALHEFEIARRALPNDVDVISMFAFIARRRGQWDDALAGLQRAALLDPRRGDFYVQLGLTHQALRRYAEADADYAQAEARRDTVSIKLDRAANTLLWKGDLGPLRKELAALEPGSDDYAGNAINFYTLDWFSRDYAGAAQLADGGDLSEAWPDQSNVALPRALYLAWALRAAGDSTKAHPLFEKVRADMQTATVKNPSDPDMQLALAFAQAALGDKPQAIAAATRASQLMPLQRDALSGAGYLVRLAQVYVQVGDNDRALALLKQLSTLPAGTVLSPAILKLDPVWDPLHRDPRFQKLLADSRPV